MNHHQQLAIRALQERKGDNTVRARREFKGLSQAEMNEVYGYSRKTRNEVVREYEAHDKAIDEAIAWIKNAR